jgi:hypothetical protein
MLRRRLPCPLVAALLAGLAPAATAAQDAWGLLEETRAALAADAPLAADFVQTYLPAGFSSGERESGRLALAVPDCLRWDYALPYPKAFLVCDGRVHAWSPEDKSGRAHELDREQQPGLDLLLLPVADLRRRYQATAATAPEGGVRVTLTPLRPRAELRQAALVLDPRSRRIVEIEFRDREGNFTRFALSGYRPLADAEAFTPPPDVRWED